jgi:hypothetical protein
MVPFCIESSSPSGPAATASTSGGPGSEVKTISALLAASATLLARRAVGVCVSRVIASGLRSNAATSWPASAT